MKKNRLLYLLLFVLLLSNGFFLFKHFGDRHNHGDRDNKGHRNFIARQLDFNDSQMQQYESLKVRHAEAKKTYDQELRILKDAFFSNISNENISAAEVDSIASLISDQEKLKDLAVFNHFKAIRAICNEEQKAKLSTIIKDGLRRRGGKGSDGRSRKGKKDSIRD